MPNAVNGPAAAPQQFDTQGLDPSVTSRGDSFDQDMFLKLLVAQLKFQNPLDPMDSSDFMAQTAQFTTVEKLQELTSSLQESLANDRLATSTGMIGRNISFTTPEGQAATETVTSVRFDLAGPVLITAQRNEVAIGDVEQVSERPQP